MDDVLWLCCTPWYQYINMRNTDFHTIDVTTNTRNGHVTPKLGFLKDDFFQQMRGRPPSAILGCNCWPNFRSKPTMNTVPFILTGVLSLAILVFFLLCLMFFPPKNNHRSWTPHVVGGLGFFILVHEKPWLVRGHPRSAKLKTCRITRSCRLGCFDIESFRLAAFFVPGNLRCLAVSPEKWWCFCGQKAAHQTYQTHQTRLFAGHCGQDFWEAWQLQLLRSETARVGCKTVSWSQITGLHMQFFDVEVIALIFNNRKGCKGCVKLMYNFWKQSLKQLVIRHQAVVSTEEL